jgi:hypothetical protein
VKAQGPTLDFLRSFKKEHGTMFTDRVNVDVHSCGGWSVESWVEAEVCQAIVKSTAVEANEIVISETFSKSIPFPFNSNIRTNTRYAAPNPSS